MNIYIQTINDPEAIFNEKWRMSYAVQQYNKRLSIAQEASRHGVHIKKPTFADVLSKSHLLASRYIRRHHVSTHERLEQDIQYWLSVLIEEVQHYHSQVTACEELANIEAGVNLQNNRTIIYLQEVAEILQNEGLLPALRLVFVRMKQLGPLFPIDLHSNEYLDVHIREAA